jgi:DNA-binding transcriptional MocR family regulator
MTAMQVEHDKTEPTDAAGWTPRLARAETNGGGRSGKDKPVYLAIADAIAEDVREGRLSPGQRLPPQRALAARIGLDFTTVSRAYGEARRRGLVDAHVGQGTFVRAAPPLPVAAPLVERGTERGTERPFIDMTMNQPPIPDLPALLDQLRRGAADAVMGLEPQTLLRYPDNAGTDGGAADKAAALRWLAPRLPGVTVERLTLCPGTQGALLALLTLLARPGDVVCAEALTYPGFKAVARQLGLTVIGAPMDGDGLDPLALRALFERCRPTLLYCMPTLHNPTTATMPLERRLALVALAREFGVSIIEDDIYGPLIPDGPPPLAALAPDRVFHVHGLAKCLSPALRVAYVVAPDARQALRVTGALRATTLMASPITSAIATRWIADGTADRLLAALREEAEARQALAATLLPPGRFAACPQGFHLWLELPPSWTRGEFATHLRTRGIAAVVSDTFATGDLASGDAAPEALRICLGAAADRAECRWVLSVIADALEQIPALAGVIV